MADARLIETQDGMTVIEDDGTEWEIYTDDGAGHYAVERDAGERWIAGEFTGDESGGDLAQRDEGSTFGVNCQDEFIVRRTDNAGSLRWGENVED
jgi:hypothetical protein